MLRLTGRLEEDGRGWELTDLPSQLPPAKARARSEEEAHTRIAELLRRHGRRCGHGPQDVQEVHGGGASVSAVQARGHVAGISSQVLQRWPTTLGRFLAILRLASGGHLSPAEARRAAGSRLARAC